ncbi:MAG: prepilin peptidase [Bacilli bacterium]
MKIEIMIFLTVLGAVMGSFLGCMGYRIPNKIKATFPSSFCNECGKPLKWYMNIPILSYIFLKGKCAYCKKPINFIYPFVEIVCALLFLCNYIMYDFTFEFWIATIITCALMVTIISDFLYYYISDRVLIISGISIVITLCYYLEMSDVFKHIIASALLFMVMYGLKLLGNYMFKKESLGDGDIKLMAIIALAIGSINSFVALFIGSVVGLLFSLIVSRKNKDGIIPFGPFLLIGALMTLYFSNIISPIITKYLVF